MRLKTASHTTDAIKGLKAPRNITDEKSVLGLCSVFRRFILSSARNTSPPNEHLRKDLQFTYVVIGKELDAIKKVHQKMISLPVLKLTSAEVRIILHKDAWIVQV